MQPKTRRPSPQGTALFFLALLLACGAFPFAAYAQGGATISGVVVAVASGQPLAFGHPVLMVTPYVDMSLDDGHLLTTEAPPGTPTVRPRPIA